jgi:hypothetical protein
MGLYVTQPKNYVSIFIAPTIDLTTTLATAEVGVACTIGKLSFGHPHYSVILGSATEELKSTLLNAGGSADNEIAYHISDYFNAYKGKVVVGRVLGADSTTKIIEVKKDADSGEILLDSSTDVNIFGDNNIVDWEETSATEMLEIVINSCISQKHSISITNVSDLVTVKVSDKNGNEVYSITGGAKFDSVDDNGTPNYIGNICDNKIITIKVDTNNDDYTSDFSLAETFDNGLVADAGDNNYANALSSVRDNLESCDYAFTAGLEDEPTLKTFRSDCYEAKVLFVCDIKGTTLEIAKSKAISLGFDNEGVMFIWNRGKDTFTNFGSLDIGLSGFIVGNSVKRNLSKLVDDVEYRVEGVAGVDYALPRMKSSDLPTLTSDEKEDLVKFRLNTVSIMNGKLVIADVLSANPKNQSTRLFNIAEGKWFIDRKIAFYLASQLFKNLGSAKSDTNEYLRQLFDKCERNGYFSSSADEKYEFDVSDKDSDTIVVQYSYVPEGVMRRGVVQGTLTKQIG